MLKRGKSKKPCVPNLNCMYFGKFAVKVYRYHKTDTTFRFPTLRFAGIRPVARHGAKGALPPNSLILLGALPPSSQKRQKYFLCYHAISRSYISSQLRNPALIRRERTEKRECRCVFHYSLFASQQVLQRDHSSTYIMFSFYRNMKINFYDNELQHSLKQ